MDICDCWCLACARLLQMSNTWVMSLLRTSHRSSDARVGLVKESTFSNGDIIHAEHCNMA